MTLRPYQTAELAMESVLSYLDKCRSLPPQDHSARSDAFETAIWCVEDLFRCQLRDGPVSPERWQRFLDESVAAFLRFPVWVETAAVMVTSAAEEAFYDSDWYAACARRTQLEIFRECYAGTPLAQLIREWYVADVDEALRRKAAAIGPVPKDDIPDWVPASHWWWRTPPHDERGPDWVGPGEEWED